MEPAEALACWVAESLTIDPDRSLSTTVARDSYLNYADAHRLPVATPVQLGAALRALAGQPSTVARVNGGPPSRVYKGIRLRDRWEDASRS